MNKKKRKAIIILLETEMTNSFMGFIDHFRIPSVHSHDESDKSRVF